LVQVTQQSEKNLEGEENVNQKRSGTVNTRSRPEKTKAGWRDMRGDFHPSEGEGKKFR